ncbi:glycoside hydrolase family 13 protein [Helcobacillus sp. ACRRO]|uniref:glycoside hydrolase family 13 protein n=1 Tax=Helcobacillus sp. ACRRO TaxID=2918202 RepID=UPI001EF53A3C|nr:glycoside hydrolase family 13 protein [Helcobacillus sp. ACRRO]MCG7426359.1 glycoside hydrolase family 13 protein [Helcobacillus sp. ACRRO]
MTAPFTPTAPGLDLFAAEPFHDSGPLCTSASAPALGDTVEVRLWVPDLWHASAVALRQVRDGEPVATALEQGPADGAGHWFTGEVLVHNPVTRYRFCVVGSQDPSAPSPLPYAWVTAAGIRDHDVTDADDFTLIAHTPAPDWVGDAIVYQIFPDRFARAAHSPTTADGLPDLDLPDWAEPMRWSDPASEDGHRNGVQLFGGDLDGIIEHLDHIQGLGADTVYLTPIFPAGSVHRYDASAFERVDPLLGGDDALARLSAALHERGMRLILDLTTNHTGDRHAWFQAALADPTAPERDFYLFSGDGDDYVGWLGVPSLPKLDHRAPAMRRALYEGADSVTAHWLAEPFSADGWRIDVANMTGRHGAQDLAHEVARTMRRTLGRQHWLIAEHGHDATRDLDGDGWHGTMNYAGFTRPLWAWLADPDSDLNWLGLPMSIPRLPGGAATRTLRGVNAQMPYPSRLHSQNLLSSHDTPRIRTVTGDAGRTRVALGLLACLPGVPTLFAGDELGLHGLNGEHSRTPMPWDLIDGSGPASAVTAIDHDALTTVQRSFAARAASPALRRGGIRWIAATADALVFIRTHPEGSVLIHAARTAHDAIEVPTDLLLGTVRAQNPSAALLHVGGAACADGAGVLRLSAEGPGLSALPLTDLT